MVPSGFDRPYKNKLDEKILILLENNSLTLSELSTLLGYKTIPGALKKALTRLIDNNKIQMEGKKYKIIYTQV